MNFYSLSLIFIIFLIFYFFLKNFKLFEENIAYSKHKSFGSENKQPIVLGGIYILTIFLIYNWNISIHLKLSAVFIACLGFMSDRNILPNPKLRLIIQILILLFFVFFEGLKIHDLRHDVLNLFLDNNYFNIFFTVFCLAILINGSNFIDGLNGLLSGYFILVILSLFFINYYTGDIVILDQEFLMIIFFTLFVFFIFNIFGHVYLGDSGSYLISFLIGVYLIELYSTNNFLSPYYVAVLLWYPAFENFFSLARRIKKKRNVSVADNFHFHQIVFLFLKSQKTISPKYLNTISGILLVICNIPSIIVATMYASKSNILISLLLINLSLYLIVYYFLFKKFIRNK